MKKKVEVDKKWFDLGEINGFTPEQCAEVFNSIRTDPRYISKKGTDYRLAVEYYYDRFEVYWAIYREETDREYNKRLEQERIQEEKEKERKERARLQKEKRKEQALTRIVENEKAERELYEQLRAKYESKD